MPAGFNVPRVIRLLSIANNDLPSAQYRRQKLLAEESTLKRNHENLVKTHKILCDDISDGYTMLHRNRLSYAEKKTGRQNIALENKTT